MSRVYRVLLVVAGVIWLGIQLEFPTWVIRYRLTLTIEIDGGEATVARTSARVFDAMPFDERQAA